MLWHRTLEYELATCLAINPAQMGHEVVGRDRALFAWRSLLKNPSFIGLTVESELPVCDHRIVGFGAGVFVASAFLDQEFASPRPGLNARIIASIAEGRSVVLSKQELKRANTCEGLDVVFLTAATRSDVLGPEELEQVRSQLWLACLLSYRGYRFHRVVRESTDAADVAYMTSHGVYGTVLTFEKFHHANPKNPWNRDRALMVSTRDDAMARPGSVPAILYSFNEPMLSLSDGQQQLIEAAVRGLTDEELAQSLSLKVSTIKKRWAAVFDHVARLKPDLVVTSDNGPAPRARGRQKRHHLLAYLREHPEELRPWLRSPRSATTPTRRARSA